MPKYIKIQRFVPNYGLELKDFLKGIYDCDRLKGLHYIIKATGRSTKSTIETIAGEEFTVHHGSIDYNKSFDCQKSGIDELDIINLLKEIKKKAMNKYYIPMRFYLAEMKLLDLGNPFNKAEHIIGWQKHVHIDISSPLGKLISPEDMPIEADIVAHPKYNKKGDYIINKKKILLQIDTQNIFLKGKKIKSLCHGISSATVLYNGSHIPLFMIARCKGYVEYQTIPIFVSDQKCELIKPQDI